MCYTNYGENMKKILCLGHASYDITIPVRNFPEENTKYRINQRIECGGGPAANAAYLLGKWGSDVYFSGVIGDDQFGKLIVDEFKDVNVNLKYLEVNKNENTTTSYIINNLESGSRTILTYRENDYRLENTVIDENFDAMLIDGQEYEMSKKILLSENKPKITIIDASRNTNEIIELCKLVDYLVCSKKFAESYTGITIDINDTESIHEAYTIMKKTFNNNVVITLEEEGALYSDGAKIKLMPALKIKALDTTGAGDIFHGAFTYAISNGYTFEQSLKIASIAGGLSVMKIGGRYSVSSLDDVLKIYEQSNK